MPTFNAEGTDLYYQVQGEGTPIIFIHPPMLTSANFKYQVEGLSEQFQTIVFDIRGHGNSAFSEEYVTFLRISKDIKLLMDHLQIEQAYLCGYSTGGTVALDFLLAFPDRAKGAILLGPMPEVNDWRLKQEIKLAVFLSKNRLVAALRYAICFGNADNKPMFNELYNEAKKGNSENIKQYYQSTLTYNCTPSLHKITKPVMLLYGAKNKQFHKYAQMIESRIPNNQLMFIQNAKHQLPTKAFKDTNAMIHKFILEHSLSNQVRVNIS